MYFMRQKPLREICSFLFVSMPVVIQPLLSFMFLAAVANVSTLEVYGTLSLSIVLMSLITSLSDFGLRDFLLSKRGIEKGLSKGENLFIPSVVSFLFLGFLLSFYVYISGSSYAFNVFLMYLPEAFAFGVLHKCLFYTYQKDLNPVKFSKIDTFHKSLPFIVKLLVLFIFEDVGAAVLAGSLSAFVTYTIWFIKKCMIEDTFFSKERFTPYSVLIEIKQSWKAWLPFTLSFLSFFLYFSSDRLIIDAILSSTELGVYAAAYSFVAIGQVLVTVIWSLYMPKISRGKEPFERSFFLKISVLLSMFVIGFYQTFSWFGFEVIYPGSFDGAKIILSILSLFFVFRLPNVIYEMYWVAWDRYSLFARLRIISGLINVVLNILLIPIFGLIVAAVTTVVSEAILTFSILIIEKKWKAE